MPDLPLLLLDVDGVLNPTVNNPPPGYSLVERNGYRVHISRAYAEGLAALTDDVEFVWASTWEDAANDSIGPLLGLPTMRSIRFGADRTAETWKLPYVDQYVGDRALIWIEDNLFQDAHDWAGPRSAPTLLIKPASSVGMTASHFDEIHMFLRHL